MANRRGSPGAMMLLQFVPLANLLKCLCMCMYGKGSPANFAETYVQRSSSLSNNIKGHFLWGRMLKDRATWQAITTITTAARDYRTYKNNNSINGGRSRSAAEHRFENERQLYIPIDTNPRKSCHCRLRAGAWRQNEIKR